MELVAPPETGINGRLLLRVLDRDRRFAEAPEGRREPSQRLEEDSPAGPRRPRGRRADDLDHVLAGVPGGHVQVRRRVGVDRAHQCVATTRIAVTSTFSVASGSSTFHPKLISWA